MTKLQSNKLKGYLESLIEKVIIIMIENELNSFELDYLKYNLNNDIIATIIHSCYIERKIPISYVLQVLFKIEPNKDMIFVSQDLIVKYDDLIVGFLKEYWNLSISVHISSVFSIFKGNDFIKIAGGYIEGTGSSFTRFSDR